MCVVCLCACICTIYVYICMCVFIYVCMCVHIGGVLCMCVSLCACVFMFVCGYMHVHACVYMCVYVCAHVFLYVVSCVCVCMCMYVCACVEVEFPGKVVFPERSFCRRVQCWPWWLAGLWLGSSWFCPICGGGRNSENITVTRGLQSPLSNEARRAREAASTAGPAQFTAGSGRGSGEGRETSLLLTDENPLKRKEK